MSYRPSSRDGFQALPGQSTLNTNNGDHVVNIPLTPIRSNYSKEERPSSDSRERLSAKRQETTASLGPAHMFGTGGRRRKPNRDTIGGSSTSRTVDGEEDAITRAGKFYDMIMNFSFVTRYIIYVIPVALLLFIPIIIGLTAAKGAELGGVKIVWIFAWTEVLWGSLWASKIVAKCLPYVFKTCVGVVSSGTRKYYKIIQNLERPLSFVGWFFVSWVTFIPMMTRNPDQRARNDTGTQPWESRLSKVLAAFLISSLVWLGKCVLIQVISVRYHQVQFSARIKNNKDAIRLLAELFGQSRNIFPSYCDEFAEEDYILHQGINLSALNTPGHRRSGSATPMRILGQIGRVGDNLTSVVGNVAKEVTGKNVLNPNSPYSVVQDALNKRSSSEALARRIWMSFVEEGRDQLYLDDLKEVFGYEHQDLAKDAYAVLDADNNGDVGLDEMISSVLNVSREKKSLSKSMGDIDSAISSLNSLLSVIIFIIMVFIFIALLNANFTTTLATAGTTLLSLSFIFSVTAQEILGSCIFIFVKHPYDVGDRVDLDNNSYVVEHIALLFTVFKNVLNNKTCQIPNNILNGKLVENVTRSKAMQEIVCFAVNFDTSMEDILLLRDELFDFVDQNNRDFRSDNLNVEINSITMGQLELKVEIKHKGNWADEAKRLERRNKFMSALVLALRKVPIHGPGAGDPALGEAGKPHFSVNITAAEAEERMQQAALDKKAAHMKAHQAALDAQTTSATIPQLTTTGASPNVTPVATFGVPNPYDPRDEVLDQVPPQLGRSNSRISQASQRARDVNEVRDLLRRQSTVGRRRRGGSNGANGPGSPYTLTQQDTRNSFGSQNREEFVAGQQGPGQMGTTLQMQGIQESPPQSSGGSAPPRYSNDQRTNQPRPPPPPQQQHQQGGIPPSGPFSRM